MKGEWNKSGIDVSMIIRKEEGRQRGAGKTVLNPDYVSRMPNPRR
jgi:hypothetical protein